jgi:hypothetical protein
MCKKIEARSSGKKLIVYPPKTIESGEVVRKPAFGGGREVKKNISPGF